MTGKRVMETTQPISKDITLFQLDIKNVREGMYILMVRCGNKVHNQKLNTRAVFIETMNEYPMEGC